MKTTDQLQAIRQFLLHPPPLNSACSCIGPQLLDELSDVSKFKQDIWNYNLNDREPFCNCAMNYVEEVNGIYYKIIEKCLLDVTTYDAIELGPRGGPYILDQNEKLHTEDNLLLEDRIALAKKIALDPDNYSCKSWFVYEKDNTISKIEIINGKFITTKLEG